MPVFNAHPNLAVSLVATAPSPATSGTSLVVTAGEGVRFGSVFPIQAAIQAAGALPTPATTEIVTITARATDTLTIIRAQEGSTARTVIVGDMIAVAITAKALQDLETGNSIVVAKSASFTAALTEEKYVVNTAAGAVVASLPAASTAPGKRYGFKKTTVDLNPITIDPNGSELIDNGSTLDVTDYLESITVFCDGSVWWVD